MSSFQDIRMALKPLDAWLVVWIFDPVAVRIVYWLANYTRISANVVSVFSILLGLVACALFWMGTGLYWIAAGLIFYLSFLGDCVDGKLARFMKKESLLGRFLDHFVYLGVLYACIASLGLRSYLTDGGIITLWLGGVLVLVHMLITAGFALLRWVSMGVYIRRKLDPTVEPHTLIWLARHRMKTIPSVIDAVIIAILGSALSGQVVICFAVSLLIILVNAIKYPADRFFLNRSRS